MKATLFRHLTFIHAAVAVFGAVSFSHADRLIGFNAVGGSSAADDNITYLSSFNPANGLRTGAIPVASQVYSVARDPASDIYYIITRSSPSSTDPADQIAQINVVTGAITNRVNLSQSRIAGITVGPNGTIYGVLGGNTNSGTIFTINPITGVATDTGWATTKDVDGQSIEYNPDDGMIYHFSRDSSTNQVASLEKIDPANGNVTAVGNITSPDDHNDIPAVVYKGGGEFYAASRAFDELLVVTTGGAVSAAFNAPEFRGPNKGEIRALELAPDLPDNSALKASLRKKIKKFKKAAKAARKKGKTAKAKRLLKKAKRLQKKLNALD